MCTYIHGSKFNFSFFCLATDIWLGIIWYSYHHTHTHTLPLSLSLPSLARRLLSLLTRRPTVGERYSRLLPLPARQLNLLLRHLCLLSHQLHPSLRRSPWPRRPATRPRPHLHTHHQLAEKAAQMVRKCTVVVKKQILHDYQQKIQCLQVTCTYMYILAC